MPVLIFDPQKTNFIRQGSTAYFLTCLDGRTLVLVPNACPHRGGPLHLGTLDLDRDTVTCPWHDIAIPVRRLQRSAVPLVYRKDRAMAVLQDGGAEQPRCEWQAMTVSRGSDRTRRSYGAGDEGLAPASLARPREEPHGPS